MSLLFLNMYRWSHIACIVLLIAIQSCTSPCQKRLADIESYIQDRPDSALLVLESISPDDMKTVGDAARFSLLHTMAIDKNYIDTADISLIMPAVTYYSKDRDSDEYMKAMFYLGRLNRHANNCQDAIVASMIAKDIAGKAGDLYWEAMAASEIAYTYSWNYISEEELAYILEAHNLWTEYGDPARIAKSMSNLATAYANVGEYYKADSLLADLCVSYPEDCSYVVKRAHNALKIRDYDSGVIVKWFEEAMDGGADMTLDNYYEYAYALTLCGETAAAQKILSQLEPYPKTTKAHHLLFQIAEVKEDYKEAFHELKKYIDRSDSVVLRQLDQSVYKAVANQSRLEAEQMETKKDKAVAVGLLSTVVFLCLVLAVLALFRYRKHAMEMEIGRLLRTCDESSRRLESMRIESELKLEDKNRQLESTEERLLKLRSSFARIYQNQLKAIGHLFDYNSPQTGQHLDALRQSYSSRMENILNAVRKETRNQKEFEAIVNKELDNIMQKLREDFPKFSEEDYTLLSYWIVGFDATTCSILLDCTENNLRVRKTRLTKKIQASGSGNLDLYMAFLAPKKKSGRKPNS